MCQKIKPKKEKIMNHNQPQSIPPSSHSPSYPSQTDPS